MMLSVLHASALARATGPKGNLPGLEQGQPAQKVRWPFVSGAKEPSAFVPPKDVAKDKLFQQSNAIQESKPAFNERLANCFETAKDAVVMTAATLMLPVALPITAVVYQVRDSRNKRIVLESIANDPDLTPMQKKEKSDFVRSHGFNPIVFANTLAEVYWVALAPFGLGHFAD